MEKQEVRVRKLGVADLEAVAKVHRAAFPTSALTRLGEEAVRQYYLWLMNDAEEIYAFGAFTGERMVGFLFGGIVRWNNMSAFLKRNRGLLFTGFLRSPWLLADPLFRNRIGRGFRALLRRPQTNETSPRETPSGAALKRPFDAVSCAILPEFQGHGIGRQLMLQAETTARENGFHVMTGWLELGNEQALHAWEKIGWQKLVKNGEWRGVVEHWLNR